MSIVDDAILEDDESFDVTLERTPDLDSRITLDPVDAVVEIIDDDGRYYENIHMRVHKGDCKQHFYSIFPC